MCPACFTAIALIASGVVSTGSLAAFLTNRKSGSRAMPSNPPCRSLTQSKKD